MFTAQDLKIQRLKEELALQMPGAFCNAEKLKKPQGFPTGSLPLDRFLEGGGLPKGSLSLLSGALGMGATSLWIESAAHALSAKKWVAWVSRDVPLMPISLQQKGMNLGHFVAVESPLKKRELDLSATLAVSSAVNSARAPALGATEPSIEISRPTKRGSSDTQDPTKRGSSEPTEKPRSQEKLAWLLQELMSSGLFDLIGCDLGEEQLRVQDLRKLQAQARETNIALVFLTRHTPPKGASAALFALILKFERRRILIERALHRPTPQSFPRSVSYDRFTLHTADRIGARQSSEAHLKERESNNLSQTS